MPYRYVSMYHHIHCFKHDDCHGIYWGRSMRWLQRWDVGAMSVRWHNIVYAYECNVWDVPEFCDGMYHYQYDNDGYDRAAVHRPEPVRWLHRRDIWAV